MAHRSDRRSHWYQMVLAFGVVIIAVVLVRMDLRQQRNNRIRMLCAEYWGAADGGDRTTGLGEDEATPWRLSWICLVSVASTVTSSSPWLAEN